MIHSHLSPGINLAIMLKAVGDFMMMEHTGCPVNHKLCFSFSVIECLYNVFNWGLQVYQDPPGRGEAFWQVG